MGIKLLVLTDHQTHTEENSLYSLLRELRKNPHCTKVDVASRSSKYNQDFFVYTQTKLLYVQRVAANFSFKNRTEYFEKKGTIEQIDNYNFILFRLPHPISLAFVKHVTDNFPLDRIINNPYSVIETGSKKYLLQFSTFCPPMKLCHTIKDVQTMSQKYAIVLKPLHSHGGKGIIKLEKGQHVQSWKLQIFPILAVKFLKNVCNGDKRINVVNGKVVAATLRIPKKGEWLCNVSKGGKPKHVNLTKDEKKMVADISATLVPKGIIIMGIDTLENDDGVRVLSEINTASIGGFPQAQKLSKKPVLKKTVDILVTYMRSILQNP